MRRAWYLDAGDFREEAVPAHRPVRPRGPTASVLIRSATSVNWRTSGLQAIDALMSVWLCSSRCWRRSRGPGAEAVVMVSVERELGDGRMVDVLAVADTMVHGVRHVAVAKRVELVRNARR